MEPTAPALVLDAGTGLQDLTGLLGEAPFRGTILLSHLHWDHVQGLPFCRAVDNPAAKVELVVPGPAPESALRRFMSPPLFPIEPSGLLGAWSFRSGTAGPRELASGLIVTQAEIAHKGGVTVGTRVSCGGVSMAYLPDHAPQRGSGAAEELCADTDLLLHDGQFLPAERRLADLYGHATVEDAMEFAARCRARRLVLTHHAPNRTDDELDALAKEYGVEFAHQGETLIVRLRRTERTDPAGPAGFSARSGRAGARWRKPQRCLCSPGLVFLVGFRTR
jgi:ribonuclease BN (tRNA processing enzyme)